MAAVGVRFPGKETGLPARILQRSAEILFAMNDAL